MEGVVINEFNRYVVSCFIHTASGKTQIAGC